MLTAVKSFILDSLSMVGEDNVEERDLSIDMGRFTVMMAAGRSLNLVAITSRDRKENVRKQLEKGVNVLDKIFGDILDNWDGDMSKLEGVKPYVESLVKGKFDDETIKEMGKPLPAPEEPPTLPSPPEERPELGTGGRTVTVSLPGPINIPDTTKALPEKSELTKEAERTSDILSTLDDILKSGPAAPPPPPEPPRSDQTPAVDNTDGSVRIVSMDARITEDAPPLPPPGSTEPEPAISPRDEFGLDDIDIVAP